MKECVITSPRFVSLLFSDEGKPLKLTLASNGGWMWRENDPEEFLGLFWYRVYKMRLWSPFINECKDKGITAKNISQQIVNSSVPAIFYGISGDLDVWEYGSMENRLYFESIVSFIEKYKLDPRW